MLSPTTLQSDQEEYLVGLLKAVANKMGNNFQVRQSPAYSSQSQGSIERYHRTLLGQVRTLTQQVADNYSITISNTHPILPWIIRHAAYLLNRYAVHNDGRTSFQRRWQKAHKQPLCEIAETVQYMIPTLKTQPKLAQRFYKGIWLGRDTMTGESIIGVPGRILRVRTIRRQIMPEYAGQVRQTTTEYNQRLPMDCCHNSGQDTTRHTAIGKRQRNIGVGHTNRQRSNWRSRNTDNDKHRTSSDKQRTTRNN